MLTPGEHKTVQARILKYAGEIGWSFVSRDEAQRRRGFNAEGNTPQESARRASVFFGDVLYERTRIFNGKYKEAEGALIGDLVRLKSDIYGNRDFLTYLRNQGKFFCDEEGRELDLQLIDYADVTRSAVERKNVYEVSEEFYVHNGRYGTREDVVFLINGIPVLVVECKNATKNEAIALGVDQIRRYHTETPEVMVPEMLFTATEAIGFSYGVTWNTVRRNIFNWKHEQLGQLEAKIKTFCDIPHVLRLLKDFILFAEKEEELQKIILRQHQATAVDRVVDRALQPQRSRGLVWHTQGSGKTYTMIKAAELLFKAPEANKPTILLMIDRNELEDQMLRNLAAVGLSNVSHAYNIAELNRLLRTDYRGIVVTMIHKFRDMPAKIGESLHSEGFAQSTVDNALTVASELLTNVKRHAPRSAAYFEMKCRTAPLRHLQLCVGDDGGGFDLQATLGQLRLRMSEGEREHGLLRVHRFSSLVDAIRVGEFSAVCVDIYEKNRPPSAFFDIPGVAPILLEYELPKLLWLGEHLHADDEVFGVFRLLVENANKAALQCYFAHLSDARPRCLFIEVRGHKTPTEQVSAISSLRAALELHFSDLFASRSVVLLAENTETFLSREVQEWGQSWGLASYRQAKDARRAVGLVLRGKP